MLALLPLLIFQNCIETNSSHVAPANGELESESSGNRFLAAKQVIKTNCSACHYAGSSGGNLLFENEIEYVRAKLVTPGSVSTSKLITRLRNYQGQVDGRTMPPSGPIPDRGFAALTAWVGGMAVADTELFSCSSDEPPALLDARRLSKKEMLNSLRLMLARALGAAEAEQILTGAASTFTDRVPNDSRAPFAHSDRAVESGHADAYFALADELSGALTSSTRLSRLITTYVNYAPGSCTNLNLANLSAGCRDAFVTNFMLRLWGRPFDAGGSELADYRSEFAAGLATGPAVGNFLFRAFLSPSFLHHVYTDVTPVAGGGSATALSSFAVARRLSYHFRLSGLDEDLIQLASGSDLRADANYAVLLNALGESAAPLIEDFTDDWLKLHRIPSIATPNTPKWARVATGLNVDDQLRRAMRQEIIDFVTYLYRSGRPIQELLTSDVALARNADLMKIYGQTTAAPVTFNEATAVRLPAGERAGLATRAGYLLNPGESERPVIRGLHVLNDLLCTEVKGQIPAEAASAVIPSGLFTTREKYDQVTAGSSCIGCHAQINPVGNAFAEYNAFGGFQRFEPIFVNGVFRQDLPTDARVNLRASVQEDVTIEGAVPFSRWMATSAHFRACVSRQYQAYAQRMSTLPTGTNSCDMNRMAEIVRGNGSLADFLRAPAVNAQFRRRNLGL